MPTLDDEFEVEFRKIYALLPGRISPEEKERQRGWFLAGAAAEREAQLAAADEKIATDTDLFNAGYDTGMRHEQEAVNEIVERLREKAFTAWRALEAPKDGRYFQQPIQAVSLADVEAAIAELLPESGEPQFVERWEHGCAGVCASIELWIARCPHCGMPAPDATGGEEQSWPPTHSHPKPGQPPSVTGSGGQHWNGSTRLWRLTSLRVATITNHGARCLRRFGKLASRTLRM